MKQLLAFCIFLTTTCSAMETKVFCHEQFFGILKIFDLHKPSEIHTTKQTILQQRAVGLVAHLLKECLITHEDSMLLLSCIEGHSIGIIPSTIVIRDLCVYFAAIGSHDELATSLYRSIEESKTRIAGIIPQLFFVASVRGCPVLAKRILRGCTLLYNKYKVTTFFVQIAPVFFYLNDRELLITMGNALGKAYVDEDCLCALVAGIDGDLSKLKEHLKEHTMLYQAIVKALLVGCASQPQTNRIDIIQYLGSTLEKDLRNKPLSKFTRMLIAKAKQAKNTEIVAYLQRT